MINHFKFKSYNSFNFVNSQGGNGIKIEIYNANFRIDYFDYVSLNKINAVKKLRNILKKGIDSDSCDYKKGVSHLILKSIRHGKDNVLHIFISGKQ